MLHDEILVANETQEVCPDRKLSQVSNRTVMEKNGWKFNSSSENDTVWASVFCGEYSWFGFHHHMDGSVSTTFKGSGTATLSFGNCVPLSSSLYKVSVVVNGEIIAVAMGNVMKEEMLFSFIRGDNLIIKVHNAIIKINSLDITCN